MEASIFDELNVIGLLCATQIKNEDMVVNRWINESDRNTDVRDKCIQQENKVDTVNEKYR